MIEVTPAERAAWAEALANRPSRHPNFAKLHSETSHGTADGAPHRSGERHGAPPNQASHADQQAPPEDLEPENDAVDEWTLGGTQVFCIASGKGGVGKSTITANLAACFAKRGLAVGILDADLNGFSIPRMLGVHEKAQKANDSLQASVAHGAKVMSLGMFTNGDDAVIWRGPVMNRALGQFLGETDWGELDVLLVDLPPGTGDIAISIANLLPQAEILIVTTPQIVAAEVAARAGAMTAHTQQRVRGVVENMSWLALPDGSRLTPFGVGGGAQVAAQVSAKLGETIPLLAQIPLDDAVWQGGDEGVPVVLRQPESASARAIEQLANLLVT